MNPKLRIVLYLLLGGLPVSIAALGAGHFAWQWLAGIVLAASFVPVALFGPQSGRGQFGVILPVLFTVTVLCTWSEAVIFMPAVMPSPVRALIGSTIMCLIVAVVLAALAWALKLTRPSGPTVEHRGTGITIMMVVICGIAYTLYYLIFGGITYQFFTKGYYPEATQIVERLGLWFWAIEIGRGALMTLGVLPVIYSLRMSRWQAAIVVGLLVWVAGGAASLIPPNSFMGTTQRMIHIVEILTQNASLGITAVLLLRPKAAPVVAVSRAAA
ncbi:MAG: hypothetical protein HY233_07105 [Acidobacteriales bacterium]|nr:hypothetical protein [Terriglobales bacterium]